MTYKQIVTVDFETYFSKDYTLKSKSLNLSEYVRDERFKIHCVAIKIDDKPVLWVDHSNVERAIASIDWTNSALLAHHTAFDGFILRHHFGVAPNYYLDTLSMGRALHSNNISASLESLGTYYGVGNKLPDVLNKTKGLEELDSELLAQLGAYCAVDVELCKKIFDLMLPKIPQAELDLIDLTARMFCDPVLEVDIERVKKELEREKLKKKQLIEKANVDITELSSAEKFANLLRKQGVEPPTKISPRTNKETWAFSKADAEFQALADHEYEAVQDLVRARLAAKSTIGETRAQRFIDVGSDGKKLPVYLVYYGAHTGRWSAGNKMNLQNLKRGGELRKSIIAPEGHSIVVADSSQIEARMLAWVAQDQELLELFRKGEDVYKHMASSIYDVEVDEVDDSQRFVGKVAVLGLGYGMGWKKFQSTLELGLMGEKVNLSNTEAAKVVTTYRAERRKVVEFWNICDQFLRGMYTNSDMTYKCLKIIKDELNKIWLPNGLYLQYPGLSCDYDPDIGAMTDFMYFNYENAVKIKLGLTPDFKKSKRLYGGILAENIVQALARIVIAEQMLEISKRHRVVTMTHDEIVVVTPTERAAETYAEMVEIMKTPPKWCEDIPISAKGGYDINYSK